MDQATTWTGKLSLTELPYRLCPDLQRRYVRAAIIGSGAQPLPRRVAARLPICAEKFANTAMARFRFDDTYARRQFPQDQASAADLRHTRSTEFESIAKKSAYAQAEKEARGMYKKLADKLRRRISQRIVQAIADGELRFAGRVGEQVDVLIPPHLAGSLQVDPRTVSLPPDGDDQGMVWRDVFVSCTPAKKKRGNRSSLDDEVVAEMRHDVDHGLARSLREAAKARLSRVDGASPEAKIKRLTRKARQL